MEEELSMDDIYMDDEAGSTEQGQESSDGGLGGADVSIQGQYKKDCEKKRRSIDKGDVEPRRRSRQLIL